MRLRLAGLAIGILTTGSVYAQYVISAHSGVIQLVEGKAYLNDQSVDPKFGKFPDIKDGQEFRTDEGRAEVLLTPGVFLRMGENSSIRMVSSRLSDTRVEILKGSAIVECDEIPKDNSIMLMYQGNTMMLMKHGLYRVDSDPGTLKVFDGEAIVKADSGQLTLKGGKETALNGVLMAQNFDKNDTDELYRWSDRRAGYLAKANISSAMALRNDNGYGYSGFGLFGFGGVGYGYPFGGYGYGLGGWQYNPLFGMYTYVPYSGFGYSPFGYGWYSPASVVYAPLTGGRGTFTGLRTPATTAVANNSGRLSNASGGSVGGGPISAGSRSGGGGGGFSAGGFSGGHGGGGGHR